MKSLHLLNERRERICIKTILAVQSIRLDYDEDPSSLPLLRIGTIISGTTISGVMTANESAGSNSRAILGECVVFKGPIKPDMSNLGELFDKYEADTSITLWNKHIIIQHLKLIIKAELAKA